MTKKLIFILLIILITIFSQFKCDKSPNSNNKETPDAVDVSYFSVQNYPKVDGSTSTHPLQQVMACKILGAEYQWYDYNDGTQRIRPVGSNKKTRDFINNITHNGTHGSYVNLLTDSADIIIVAREPSTDEISLADSLGITLQTQAVALDAFVFILNVENPVNDLTVEQIRGIYTGDIRNWQEVGGINAAINPYQRNRNSGSQELMETLVMKELSMVDAPQMILSNMMGPINNLVLDPFGICYTVYFFNEYMAPREQIKLCRINGVKPDFENISTGKYVFSTKVFAAIRSNLDTESTAFTLWKWLQTTAGQKVISESGYVPFP